MKRRLSIIVFLMLSSCLCTNNSLCAISDTVKATIDSFKVVEGIAIPHDLQGISIKYGRVATISRDLDRSYLTVFDLNGETVFSTTCGPAAAYCELISEGNKVFINRIIAEGHHVSEVYDIIKGEKSLSFICNFYVYPSPNGNYFYSEYFYGFSDLPFIYDSDGNVMRQIEHSIRVWNMKAIDDTTIIFAEGNRIKVITIPEFKVIEEYEFESLSKPALEIGLSVSPDGSVFGIYTPDSIVIFDRNEQTQYTLAGSYPQFLGGDDIIISENGTYIISLTRTPAEKKPAYNLYKKSIKNNKYVQEIGFKSLPVEASASTTYHRHILSGSQIIVYYFNKFDRNGNLREKQFPSILIQLPRGGQNDGFVFGSSDLIVPITGDNKSFISLSFNDDLKSSVNLEYKTIQIE